MIKRIGFDARYINDQYHGVGRYAFRLLEALVNTKSDYKFIVFTGQGIDRRFDWSSITTAGSSPVTFQAGPWPLYWPQEQLLWPYYIRRYKVDLLHTPYFVNPLFVGSNTPKINTVHDLIFNRYPLYMPQSWARPYYKLLMKWSLSCARDVIAVSRATAQDINTFYPSAANKVRVIGEGVDPKFNTNMNGENLICLRNKYQLNNPFILTVGARRPHKNLKRLIQAYKGISDKSPHDLAIVGPSDTRFPDDAKLEVEQNRLNGRVRFLDWVPEPELPGLYKLADLVVLPSIVEGYGLPALEAMACGTPVVAANNSSYPEIIGNAGVLVEPFDVEQLRESILDLLDDPAQRKLYSEMGSERAACFTWEGVAGEILDVYEQVLG